MSEEDTQTPTTTDDGEPMGAAEQAMADTASTRQRGRRNGSTATAEAPAKVVRHKDPVTTGQTLRQHIQRHPAQRRHEMLHLARQVLLDPEVLAMVKAVDALPGALDGEDLDVAQITALHRLP